MRTKAFVFSDPSVSMVEAAISKAMRRREVEIWHSLPASSRGDLVQALRWEQRDREMLDALDEAERERVYNEAWAAFQRRSP